MDSEKWNKVLIEWVNCLKLHKSIKNMKELRNGKFYSELQSVLTKNSETTPKELSTFIFELLQKHYPKFTFPQPSDVKFNEVAVDDLNEITSLLMHYTCIYDRSDILTSPLCHSLSPTTQLIIKNFLEKIDGNSTRETLNDAVKFCLESVGKKPDQNKKFSFHTCQNKGSPLMEILNTPVTKTGRLQEKDRVIANLKTNLEFERDEKSDLQEELKMQMEKNQKIQKQLEEKSTEISRLRDEVIELENRTLPDFQDVASKELQKRLQLEIESLEDYIRKIENEQEEIRIEKDAAREKLLVLETQCKTWQEKFFESEKSMDVINKQNKDKEEKIKNLEEYCSELSALLEEYRSAPEEDSSLFEGVKGVDLLKATPSSEDLAHSVVEVQLKDAQKQNEQLKVQIDEIQEVSNDLKKQVELIRAQLQKSEEDFTAISDFKDELLIKLETVELEHTLTKQKLNETESDLKISRHINNETQEQLKMSQREFEELSKVLQNVKSELDRSQRDKEALLGQVQKANQVSESLSKKIENLTSLLEDSNKSAELVQNEKEELLIKLETLGLQYTISEGKLNDTKKDLDDTRNILEQKCKEYSELNLEQDNLKSMLSASENRVTEIQIANKLVKEELTELQWRTKEVIEDLKKQLQQSDEENRNIQAEREKILKQLDETKLDLAQLRTQVDELEIKLKSEYETSEEQKVLNNDLTNLNAKYSKSIEDVESQLGKANSIKEDLGISLEKANKKIENLEKDINLQVADIAESSRQISLQKQEISNFSAKMEILQREYETCRSQLEETDQNLKETKGVVKKQEILLNTSQDTNNKLEEKLGVMKISLQSILEDKSSLEGKLMEEQKKYDLTMKMMETNLEKSTQKYHILTHEHDELKLEFDTISKNYEKANVSLNEKQLLLVKAEKKLQELEDGKVRILKQLEESEERKQKLQLQLEELTNNFNDLNSNLMEKNRICVNLETLNQDLTSGIEVLTEERKEMQIQLENLTKDLETLHNEKSQLEKDLKDTISEKIDLQENLEKQEAINVELNDQIATMKNSLVNLTRTNTVIMQEKMKLMSDLNESKSNCHSKQEDITKLQEHLAAVEKESNISKENYERIQLDKEKCEREIYKINQLNSELENEQKSLLTTVDDLTTARITLETDKKKLEEHVNYLQKEYKFLEEKLRDSKEEYEGLQLEFNVCVEDLKKTSSQLDQFQEKCHNLEAQNKGVEEYAQAIKAQCAEMEKQRNQLSTEVSRAKQQSEEQIMEIKSNFDSLEAQLRQINEEYNDLQLKFNTKTEESDLLLNQLRHTEEKYDNLNREKEELQKTTKSSIEDLEASKNALAVCVSSLENQLNNTLRLTEEYKSQIKELEGVSSKLHQENRTLLMEKTELEQNLITDHEHVELLTNQLKQSEDLCMKLSEHKEEMVLKLKTLENKYQEQLSRAIEQYEKATKQTEVLKYDQSSLENQLKEMKSSYEAAQGELSAGLLENQRINSLLAKSKEYLAKLESENDTLTSKLIETDDMVRTVEIEKESIQKDFIARSEELVELRDQLSNLQNRFEDVDEDKTNLLKKLQENEHTIGDLINEKRLFEAKIEELEDGKTLLEHDYNLKLSKQQEQLDHVKNEKLALEKKMDIFEMVSQESQDKTKQLEETIQDYEMTISGLKNVIEKNLETLNDLRIESKTITDKNDILKKTESRIVNLLTDRQILSASDESGDVIYEKIAQILDEKTYLAGELENLKVENERKTNCSSILKDFLEKLQMLVLKREEHPIDFSAIEILEENVKKIQNKIEEALVAKEKLGEEKEVFRNELDRLKIENDQYLQDKINITNSNDTLELALAEEKEKVAFLSKKIENVAESRSKSNKENNVLCQNTNLNMTSNAKEEDLKKANALLKKKLMLSEHSKSTLEKIIKDLRQEKLKLSQDKSDNDSQQMKAECLQLKLDNGKLEHDLQNIKEAYGNVMSNNSKLEFENLSLRNLLEAKDSDESEVMQLKEAYETLLEENNKYITEVDTIKYKRMRDKEEFTRLLKKHREEAYEKHTKEVQQVRSEYECKLEKIKDKMLRLYREEVNKGVQKFKVGQQHNTTAIKTVAKLEAELSAAQEKIHLLEMQNELRDVTDKGLIETRNPVQTVRRTATQSVSQRNYPRQTSTFPRSIITEEITLSRRTSLTGPSLSQNFQMEDEEDLFNDKYLTDLKEGRCTLPKTGRESNARYSELVWRNSMVPPHLKSSYPAELQFASPNHFKEDEIKAGNIETFENSLCRLLPGDKPRKKDFGTTSYKRPGPPTPSKNGGRLSLQGNEVHPTRDHCEIKTPRRLTPSSRIRALFTGKNNSTKDTEDHISTPTGKRLNIFRRPR